MTKQVETLTVLGTITTSGDAQVIVTARDMSNSPKEFAVAVLSGDSASVVALKVRQDLALAADIQEVFLVGGTGADVILTARLDAANDASLNIAIANDTCDGLTPVTDSANTTAGAALVYDKYATLVQYKNFVTMRGGTISFDVNDDAVIEMLIESVSRYIDGEIGIRFYADAQNGIYYYQAKDARTVELPEFASIAEVAIDPVNIREYTAMAETEYDILPVNAVAEGLPFTGLEISPLSFQFFPTHARGVRVTGRRGRSAVPVDIRDACLAITQSLNGARSGQTSAGKITVTAAGVVIRPEDVPTFAQRVILKYRNHR